MARGPGRDPDLWEASGIPALPTAGRVLDVLLEGWSAAGRPRIIQAAVGGRWEEARSLAMPADAGAARALVRGAGPPEADVAVEFEWLGHPLVFVGARRARGQEGEDARFEEDVARLAAQDPAGPAAALALLAGGPPAELDHVELGAANAWRSVGPLRLWTRGQDAPHGAVAGGLRDHPRLARCHVPVALEVGFTRPRECWIGVEVSEPSDGDHLVAPATVERRLTRLLAPAS